MSSSTSILRVKRKPDDVPPDDILLERRPEKRRSIAALLSGISIEEHSAIMRERYHRLTLETFMTLERQLPPDKLAALVPNLRFEGLSEGGNPHDSASIPLLNTGEGGRSMSTDFTVYDVLLKPGKSFDRPHLVAMRANSASQAEETSEASHQDATEEDRDAVYDLYVRFPEEDSTDDVWQSSATVVQLIDDDGDLWAEEAEDSAHDSEDSNAEDYYANSYPDEESDWDSTRGSDPDEDGRETHEWDCEEYY